VTSRGVRIIVLAAGAVLSTTASAAGSSRVEVRPLVRTDLPLGDVVATNDHILYIAEHTGQIDQGALGGGSPRPFVTLPREGEEVRCVPTPRATAFPPGLYCHTPANNIYRVTAAGRIELFARLPERRTSDGALAFDTGGRFGYALIAATGRSNDHHGGGVYAVDPRGVVTKLGSYPGPGGAENATIAPNDFGSAAGDLLMTTDTPSREGRLLAFAPGARVSVLATVYGDGLNSLAVLPRRWRGERSGVLIADTRTGVAWFLPARELQPYRGDALVAAELRGWIYIIKPANHAYQTIRLETDLTSSKYNFEGATVVP